MTEHSNRFMLAHSSLLSQPNIMHDVGWSVEGQINRNTLWNKTGIASSDERLKDLMKLFHNLTHARSHTIVSTAMETSLVILWWKTSSSISGFYYGQCKAHAFSILISTVKCDLLNLAVKNSTLIERLKRGLLVTLKKVPINFTVENFRALLLLEV